MQDMNVIIDVYPPTYIVRALTIIPYVSEL